MFAHNPERKIPQNESAQMIRPTEKITIIGGGIIGALEAYYAFLDAKNRGQKIRVTINEKNPTLSETTTSNIVPSLTPD